MKILIIDFSKRKSLFKISILLKKQDGIFEFIGYFREQKIEFGVPELLSLMKRKLCCQITIWAFHNGSCFPWGNIINNNTRSMLTSFIYNPFNLTNNLNQAWKLITFINKCLIRFPFFVFIPVYHIMNAPEEPSFLGNETRDILGGINIDTIRIIITSITTTGSENSRPPALCAECCNLEEI